MTTKAKPLSGVRVMELGRLMAAPLAAQMLGDLGAEIIKVERPGEGDEFRGMGAPYLKDPDGNEMPGISSAFVVCNRNKKSITCDFSKPEGRALIHKLAAECDVLIENYRTGVLDRYGVGYKDLQAINPKLVWLSITGFGHFGEYAGRPGTDGIFQSMSGLMSVTGQADGPPEKVGTLFSDFTAGVHGAIAVLGALRHVEMNDGPGQFIDVALLDATFAALSSRVLPYLVTGDVPKRVGNQMLGGPIRQFVCKDGKRVYLQVSEDSMFNKFCAASGHALNQDPRFATRGERSLHPRELELILEDLFLERDRDEWVAMMAKADVMCSPVYSIDETCADPHVKSRGLIITEGVDGPLPVPVIASPLFFSETPIEVRFPPQVGVDTDDILRDLLGYAPAEIAAMREAKVV